MNKGKLVFAIFGVLGLYFVAAGGVAATGHMSVLEVVTAPLRRGHPADVILAMVALVLLTFAALPSDHGLGRTTILRGVALSSALVTAVCAASLVVLASQPESELVGVFALVMVSQAFVGLTASTLLVTRREDRRVATVPLLLNGTMAAGAVALFLVPVL